MPLPVIPDTWLVTQRYSDAAATHPLANVWCIGGPTGSVATDATIATQVAAAVASALMPGIGPTIVMADTVVTKLDGTSPTSSFVTPSAGTAGGNLSGHIMPLSCCFGITWKTALRGKRHRGRSYLPGVRSSDVVSEESRQLTTTSLAGLQTVSQNFLTALAASTPILRLRVLSRRSGTAQDVNGSRANIGVVEQRRRYERVSRH